MTDPEFIDCFEKCALDKVALNHQAHIRMAYIYLQNMPFPESLIKIREGIKKFAEHYSLSSLYNETITFWYACLIHNRIIQRKSSNFDEFIAQNLDLLEFGNTMKKYYSEEVFRSVKAKNVFILPEFFKDVLPPKSA